MVLPDRPSAGPGGQAAAETGERARQGARRSPGPRPGEGGHRRRAAPSWASADGSGPRRGVVGGGAAQPEGLDLQQLWLADAGLRRAKDRAVRLDRLSPAHVQKLYSDLRVSGGREGTPLYGTQVRNIHRVLHNALNYAVRLGISPVTRRKRLTSHGTTPRSKPSIPRSRFAVSSRAIEGDRLEAMWYLVLSTGLRRAELAGLRSRDVALDRDPPIVAIRTTRTTAGHQVVEHDPKSRSRRRVLHLDPGTADVLRAIGWPWRAKLSSG